MTCVCKFRYRLCSITFPEALFSEKELVGKAFFENAGGSYTSSFVIDRLFRFYKSGKVQPYGYHPTSELTGKEMDEARFRLSAMLNITPDSLSFGPSHNSEHLRVSTGLFSNLPEWRCHNCD